MKGTLNLVLNKAITIENFKENLGDYRNNIYQFLGLGCALIGMSVYMSIIDQREVISRVSTATDNLRQFDKRTQPFGCDKKKRAVCVRVC